MIKPITILFICLCSLSHLLGQDVDSLSTVAVKGKAYDFVMRVDTVHEYNSYTNDSMHYFNIHAVEVYYPGAKSYSRSNPKFIQRFNLKVEMLELWRYNEIPTRFLDANFDGYEDFEILHFPGMYWNSYQYFLYDPELKKFKKDTFLVKLTDPTFHKEKEYVHYEWHVGVNEFGHAVYKWQGDTLLLMGEEVMSNFGQDDNYLDCYGAKRVGDEMIEVECPEIKDSLQMAPCSMHTKGDQSCDLFERSAQ